MSRFILWDIDGTLIRGGGAVSAAYRRALRSVYRLQGDIASISYAGKTDGQIALETLACHGLSVAEVMDRFEQFRATYVAELELVRGAIAADLRVLPGVRAVLKGLDEAGAHQSLVTGNFEAAARIKLSCGALEHHFAFATSAFGSDHHDRNCLVPLAMDRARSLHGIPLPPEHVVVIGDTPRDIACARAAGVRVIAVATGTVSAEELADHRPDSLLHNLEDTAAAVAALLA